MRTILVLFSVLFLAAGIWLLCSNEEAQPLALESTVPAAGALDASNDSAVVANLNVLLAPIPASPFDGSEDKAVEDAAPVASGVTVSGRIVSTDGSPVAGAQLALEMKRIELGRLRDERRSGATGTDGRFKFAGIATGTTVVLRATPLAALEVKSQPVRLSATDHDFGTLVAARGAAVRGIVLTAHGAPAAGVRVVAERAKRPSAFSFFRNGFEPPASGQRAAMSDSEGRFCIQGLPTDQLRVSAREEGSALGTETAAESGADDLKLVLPEGAERRGLITDEAGTAISGAVVRVSEGAPATELADFEGNGPPRVRPQRLSTDASGRFHLKNVPVDLHLKASVACERFLPAQVELMQGETTIRLRRAGVVWGVVKSSEGVALTSFNATVRRGAWENFDPADGATRTQPKALSGAEAAALACVPLTDGIYAVSNLTEAAFTLTFTADGHARVRYDNVAAAAGTVQRLDVTLDKQCEVAGVVIDPAGATVAGARVSFNSSSGVSGQSQQAREAMVSFPGRVAPASAPTARNSDAAMQHVVSDAEGRFKITGLPAGSGSLIAEHDLFADSERLSVKLPQESPEALRLALRAGGSIEGLVKDEEGKALPHATITARAVREKGDRRPMQDELQSIANAEGKYRIDGVIPGPWDLRLDGQPRSADRHVMIFADSGESAPSRAGWTRCDVTSGSVTRVDLALPPVGLVTGVVRSAGRPVPGVQVEIAPKQREQPKEGGLGMVMMGNSIFGGGGVPTTTDADGRFRFERQKPGEFTLIARPSGSDTSAKVDVNVLPRATATAEITLPGGTIEGQVLNDKTGAPLAHVRVQATKRRAPGEQDSSNTMTGAFMVATAGDDDNEIMSFSVGGGDPVVTDAEGRYAVRYLSEGTWDLAFSGGGIVPGNVKGIELGLDALRTGVLFRASLGCTLTLQFDPNSDRNVDGASVSIQCGEQQEHAWLQPGRRVLKRGLAAGPCKLIATTHDGSERKVEKTITLHADGENRVEFEF